jgi:hypothetical protein
MKAEKAATAALIFSVYYLHRGHILTPAAEVSASGFLPTLRIPSAALSIAAARSGVREENKAAGLV